jgi:1-acyl-sn-glycerol-3-phosphate acyltransferase
MNTPRLRLSRLGSLLPHRWGDALLRHPRGNGALGLLEDLFLTYPPDPHGLAPATARRWFFLVEQTVGRYFRPQVIDADQIPSGRSLIIGCHSGVVPWDAACLVVALHRHTGRFSRNAGDRLFGQIAWIERFLAGQGAIVASPERLEALLRDDEMVVLFPGGAKDMTRRFWERYQVRPHRGFAPGHGGYIKIALRTGSPIVPVAIVGPEETHLLVSDAPPIARLFGLPYFPIVLSPLPLPARFYVRFGRPIHLGAPPDAARDQQTVDRLNTEVRRQLQALITDTRRRRRGIYWSSYDDAAGTH